VASNAAPISADELADLRAQIQAER
jgi:hypothetical protein